MKHLTKFISLVLAMVMVFALATTAFAADTTTYKITINNEAGGHTYEAYQIFTGDLSTKTVEGVEKKVLANIVWGTGVTYNGAGVDIDPTDAEKLSTAAADIAEALEAGTLDLDAFIADLTLVTTNASTSTQTDDTYVISGLVPGYYLVKDKDNSLANKEDEAYTSYIIQVIGDATADAKVAKPTVDKQVANESDNGSSTVWSEVADHEMFESFQFKLTATLPADTDFGAYETYTVVFEDTMSAGITFESIASVTVTPTTGEAVSLDAEDDYTCTAKAGDKGTKWTLTIPDLKIHLSDLSDLSQGAVVEVVYNAHLNEDAQIGDNGKNMNTVDLLYSNDPNASGSGEPGETPPGGKTKADNVWVFTYDIPSLKVDQDNKALGGAGFKLYSDAACANEIAVIFDETIDIDNDGKADGAYRPVKADETGVEMISAEDTGRFVIAGLDTGTYYLRETTTPVGYNTVADIKIDISASQTEGTDGITVSSSVTMEVNDKEADVNTVVNKFGTILPVTGGIGTTIFYILGAVLVLGAIVLLITKKRMSSQA